MDSDIADSPRSRAELRARVLELHKVDAALRRFIDSADELCKTLPAGVDAQSVSELLNDREMQTLDVGDLFRQLGDFADHMRTQLADLVIQPLQEYQLMVAHASRLARAFDEESEALDGTQLKYLSLPRDAPLETRAYAQQDLDDKSAAVALSLFDARCALQEACAQRRTLPQRALGEMLVSQLAYHQSCTRLLSSVMPQVSQLLADAEAKGAALTAQREADAKERAAMPRPEQQPDGPPLAEGWLLKGAFSLLQAEKKGHLSRLKPWNKRWFVLCPNGKLFYYKSAEDSKSAFKVPLNMNLVQSVSAVNGPLEFELRMGPRTLRLKAPDPGERDRWMRTLRDYLDTHVEARAATAASNRRRFVGQGLGIRDLDGASPTHSRTSVAGFLHRQDTDMMRRWRKWWCCVEQGELTCVQFESLRIADTLARERSGSGRLPLRERSYQKSLADAAASGGNSCASGSAVAGTASAVAASGADGYRHSGTAARSSTSRRSLASQEGALEPERSSLQPLPFRALQTVTLPLSTVTVREARQAAVNFCFDVISPQGTLLLQALSQEEMQLWMQVIQNGTAELLGSLSRVSGTSLKDTTLGVLRACPGNGYCADCGEADPTWASINLGVLVCLTCAGVHRQMGVHISKVRSLELDTKEWSAPLVSLMMEMGNERLNKVWMPRVPKEQLLTAEASNSQREGFIRRKYERRAFVATCDTPPSHALHVAALNDDVLSAATCLARGSSVDATVPSTPCDEWTADAELLLAGRPVLHVAAASGSEGVLELLLQNTASVDSEDQSGKTALRLAVDAAEKGCVLQLLTRGANISHADNSGKTPMQAALEQGYDDLQQCMLSYKLAQDEKLLEQAMKA